MLRKEEEFLFLKQIWRKVFKGRRACTGTRGWVTFVFNKEMGILPWCCSDAVSDCVTGRAWNSREIFWTIWGMNTKQELREFSSWCVGNLLHYELSWTFCVAFWGLLVGVRFHYAVLHTTGKSLGCCWRSKTVEIQNRIENRAFWLWWLRVKSKP